MKKGALRSCIVVLLAVTLLPLVYPYEEGIHFLRPQGGYILGNTTFPQYLSVEDITFIACTEEDFPLKSSLLCLDNNNFVDLDTYKWTDDENCYISSFNLKGIPCKDLVVQSEYTKDDENYRISKKVRVNKLTKVLDHILGNQYSDGGWRESIATAFGIWALSYYDEIFDYEIESAMAWLKMNRNDQQKCWPKSPCDMERTANILALLRLANHTDYYRVLNDGENYMEELQNYYLQGQDWSLSVSPLVPYTTLTLVSYGREILRDNFTLTNNSWTDFSFQAYTDTELMLISDENIKARIINQDGQTLINYQGDNMSYTTPGACWSKNRKGEPCDLRVTLYNTVLELPDEQKDEAKRWLETTIKESDLVGSYVGDESDPIDTSLFLYLMHETHANEDWLVRIVKWLTYNQNNEGSWGSGDVGEKAIPTAFASLALQSYGYSRESEQIEDAKQWASIQEETADQNNTVVQSALFSVLKNNARPLVTSKPSVLEIQDRVTEIDIFNPTTFNLIDVDYEFTENLRDILAIEKKTEISAYSYRKLKVTKISQQTANTYGSLIVTNLGKEIGRIPIIVSDFPTLNVSVTESMSVFGISAKLSLSATKSNHEFICEVSWTQPDIRTPGSFKVTGPTAEFQITFDQPATREEVYKGTLNCKQGEKVFEFPFSVFITRYSSEPFDVSAIQTFVNDTQGQIIVGIRNNLDQDLTVAVTMSRLSDMFSFDPQITLNPNEQKNMTFQNRIPQLTNLSDSTTITFSALTRQKTMLADVDVIHLGEADLDFIKLIIVLSFISILLSVGLYFGYQKRDELIRAFNRLNVVKLKAEVREEEKEIGEMKGEERDMIISNLYRIMKFQNKDDKEIKESLLKNFSREQITEALEKSGNSLHGLEEEDPEEI